MTARSAHSLAPDVHSAVQDIVAQLGPGPFEAVVFFAAPCFPVDEIRAALGNHLGSAPLIGCSTAGEISNRHSGQNGIAVLALGKSELVRSAVALADYPDGNVERAVECATSELEVAMNCRLKELDPVHHVGLVLIEGSNGSEERVNAALGRAAPFLSFVGGSAADNLAFRSTHCCVSSKTSRRGAALLLMELAVPFAIVKTCHFVPTAHELVATRVQGRVVHEFNNEPAAVAYARALGTSPEELTQQIFFRSPVGLVISGEPWLRSPVERLGGSISFSCEIPEGAELRIMKSTGQLVADSKAALERATVALGGPIHAGLLFNCAHRRLEMDADGLHSDFVKMLTFPAAGFHTHGETWLGHMNQSLTALVLGRQR